MASRLAKSAIGASRVRPVVPFRALPPIATSNSPCRHASNTPAQEPATKAQTLIDALPGSSLISKTAILSAGASLSVWAIANEIYVVTEETITAICTATAFGGIFYYAKPYYVEWAQAHIDKVKGILYQAKQNHRDAISDRAKNVQELGGVIDITKALFEVSKETARLEAQAYELEQKTAVANEAKTVLDSWIRYEGQVKARQQRELAESIISKINKELENPKNLQQILNQSVSDVERAFKMASPEVTSAISQLEDPASTQSNKASGYSELLTRIASDPTSPHLPSNLTAFIESVLGETIGVVAARPLLASAVNAIKTFKDSDSKVQVGTRAVQALESRVVSFEEQDAHLRHTLADAYESQEEWLESAQVLQGINLDSSQRKITDHAKVDTWIRICRLYLEEDDPTTAESYLNRAKNIIYRIPTTGAEAELHINFQLSQARILDSQRRFLDASAAYHNISFNQAVDEEERLKTLSMAITCAVLEPAGPPRSRTLAKLYKDERVAQVPEYGILEKIFLDRLLGPAEVEKFAAGLAPHQLAKTGDGTTVLARAVVQHNLLSASKLYGNIGVRDLGNLLGLGPEKAEEYASAMLQQGRLVGRIDQIEGVIFFDQDTEGPDGRKQAQMVGRELRKWDAKVQGVAEEVERVASLLQARHPDFAQANMVH
ncbi:uncharacterized protein KY384_004229 [Bacidia gigantensis]|uniref:uncharacterized protein n=1 Tax=Bacidia gigantensis TaxID=2732470 RepID=UPI001D038733|nr:uncharacterized protein KY384_004229 [Bacidia gigantensis]KAG8530872.1 hypothetical protein KY384_004229 [Bacidia gigantensis]